MLRFKGIESVSDVFYPLSGF